jgi:hypothetical protein
MFIKRIRPNSFCLALPAELIGWTAEQLLSGWYETIDTFNNMILSANRADSVMIPEFP